MSSILTWPQTVWTWLCSLSADAWAAFAALLSASAAFGAWRTAHLTKKATAALTAIEARRWHADMNPQFEVTCARARMGDHASDTRAELRIRFTGPPALHKLTITATIRDDWPDRESTLAGGPTQEQLDVQIWGPYRFVHGVDGGSQDGRTISPFTLLVGDGRPFALERTPSPRWADAAGWRQRYEEAKVRLALQCVHEDDAPWTVHLEVPVDEPKQG
ncbi:hypothetical protein [Streptosporangium sp. NPDC004631]